MSDFHISYEAKSGEQFSLSMTVFLKTNWCPQPRNRNWYFLKSLKIDQKIVSYEITWHKQFRLEIFEVIIIIQQNSLECEEVKWLTDDVGFVYSIILKF